MYPQYTKLRINSGTLELWRRNSTHCASHKVQRLVQWLALLFHRKKVLGLNIMADRGLSMYGLIFAFWRYWSHVHTYLINPYQALLHILRSLEIRVSTSGPSEHWTWPWHWPCPHPPGWLYKWPALCCWWSWRLCLPWRHAACRTPQPAGSARLWGLHCHQPYTVDYHRVVFKFYE